MRIAILQIMAGLTIAAAGLVPVAHRNKPFWGCYGYSIDGKPPRISQVDDNSPAMAAGLLPKDTVLSVNGAEVDLSGMMSVLDTLQPGTETQLRILRGEAEVDVVVRGVESPVAMVYYTTAWYPVAGGLGLAIALLMLATKSFKPVPLWRPSLIAVVAVGCGVVFLLALVQDNPFAFWQLRRYHNLNWGERLHFEQTWVGLAASFFLAVLAALELWSLFAHRPPSVRKAPSPISPG